MGILFERVSEMSLSASWLIAAMLTVRFFLRKGPKHVRILLWAFVAFRLLCPFQLESPVGLIPNPGAGGGWPPQEVMIREPSDFIIPESAADAQASGRQAAAAVWAAGAAGFLAYGAIGSRRLKKRMQTAVPAQKGVYLTDEAETPFVMGIFSPKIYLPFSMEAEERRYVLLHERAHIRHRDYLLKPLFWGILCVHWQNPLVWVSWICFCRDLELICDESVAETLNEAQRKEYAEILFACSYGKTRQDVFRTAFRNGGVKQRIKNILGYRKPTFRRRALSGLLCLTAGLCFMTARTGSSVAEAKTLYSLTGRDAVELDLEAVAEKIWESAVWTADGNEIRLLLPEGTYARGEWKVEVHRLWREEAQAVAKEALLPDNSWDGGWRCSSCVECGKGSHDREPCTGLLVSVSHTAEGVSSTLEKDLMWSEEGRQTG